MSLFSDTEVQALTDAIRDILARQEAMHCTRVWEAWSYGTMGEDDFSLVSDDEDAVSEIAQAAMNALRPGNAERHPFDELFLGTLEALDSLTIHPANGKKS